MKTPLMKVVRRLINNPDYAIRNKESEAIRNYLMSYTQMATKQAPLTP